MLPSAVPKYNILFPSYCQFWYSTSICELFCVFHQVSCKWYSCLAKFWHLYMRTAAEWEMETNDNLQLQCLYCLKKILVKIIKICKFLSDSNKEAKCAQLWIFQYSANYLLTYLLIYLHGWWVHNLRNCGAPCSEPVPLRIFWSGYGPVQ